MGWERGEVEEREWRKGRMKERREGSERCRHQVFRAGGSLRPACAGLTLFPDEIIDIVIIYTSSVHR